MRIYRLPSVLFFAFFCVLAISACKKDETVKEQAYGYIGFINASSTFTSMDLYINNQKVNQDSFSYSIPRFSYSEIAQGNHEFRITKNGTGTVLLQDTLGLKGGDYYSVFAIRKSKTNTDSTQFIAFRDDLKAPVNTARAKFRFLNFSPDAPDLDIAVKDTAYTLVRSRPFPSTDGSYTEILQNPALILQISETGSEQVKFELPAFNAQAGQIYTVYTRGLWNGTGSKAFSAVVLTNRPRQ